MSSFLLFPLKILKEKDIQFKDIPVNIKKYSIFENNNDLKSGTLPSSIIVGSKCIYFEFGYEIPWNMPYLEGDEIRIRHIKYVRILKIIIIDKFLIAVSKSQNKEEEKRIKIFIQNKILNKSAFILPKSV